MMWYLTLEICIVGPKEAILESLNLINNDLDSAVDESLERGLTLRLEDFFRKICFDMVTITQYV